MRILTICCVLVVGSLVGIGPAWAAGGDQVWRAHFVGQDSCGATGVSEATDPGNGNVYSLIRDGECILSQGDLIAYSSAGSHKWTVATGEWTDHPIQVGVDAASHDVVVASERDQKLLVQAWSSAGTKLWGKTYFLKNSELTVQGLAMDGHGHAFIAATVQTPTNSFDFVTSAYSVSSGTALWHTRYDGHPHEEDHAIGIAVDPGNKHVYVIGTSENGERDQLVTIAYSTTSGAEKWGKRATEDYQDLPQGVVVDPTNHQVYALNVPSGDAVVDMHVYSGSGAGLWHVQTGSGVLARQITVDPTNDCVYVSGFGTLPNGDNRSFVTAFTSTGTSPWTTFDSAGGDEVPAGIAVDTANHVVYETTTDDGTGVNRIVTYAITSTGSESWRTAHTSSVDGGGAYAGALAVDSMRAQVYVGGSENMPPDGAGEGATFAYQA